MALSTLILIGKNVTEQNRDGNTLEEVDADTKLIRESVAVAMGLDSFE